MSKDLILIYPNKKTKMRYYASNEALGIEYLASFLEREGFAVDLINAAMENLTVAEVVERILQDEYLVAGISMSPQSLFWDGLRIASFLKKKKNLHINVGGHFPTFAHKEILKNFPEIDSVTRGDGEYVLRDLVINLKKTPELSCLRSILGLSFRIGKRVFCNDDRPPIGNLDSLPFPRRHIISKALKCYKGLPISSSRGCFGACSFCSTHSFKKFGIAWRARSAKNVVDEIEYIYKKYGVKRITFVDDNFLGHCRAGYARASKICDELNRRHISIKFNLNCRADNVQEDLFQKMACSGLYLVRIGIESFVPRVLDMYRKGVTESDIMHALEVLRSLNIEAKLNIIMFDPFTSIDEVQYNLKRIKKLKRYFEPRKLFSRLDPLYGTDITQTLISKGVLSKSGFLEYRYSFVHSETRKLWDILGLYRDNVYALTQSFIELQNDYWDMVFGSAMKTAEFEDARNLVIEAKIKAIEFQMMNCWLELFEHAIHLAKERGVPSEIHGLFPNKIFQRFKGLKKRITLISRDLYSTRSSKRASSQD